jgi:hypothetical protein
VVLRLADARWSESGRSERSIDLTTDRWVRIESLCHAALAVASPQREGRLAALSRSVDEDDGAVVERLLQSRLDKARGNPMGFQVGQL